MTRREGPAVRVSGPHGDYDLLSEIARGGMGRIVEAFDRRHGRYVALKLLLHSDPSCAKRFEREAGITARLQHPSIVPLYEAGQLSSGEPFFALKLVRGGSLADRLAEITGTQERLALLPHVIAVCDALAYAHDEGVVHRDLKPSNILLGAFGETVVIDWGLAKVVGGSDDSSDPSRGRLDEAVGPTVTADGRVLGTPHYMPPEQARGEAVDARADVYALGACLYHVWSGSPPYEAPSGREVIGKLLASAPEPLSTAAPWLPPDLVAVVTKAMARDPDDRYPTAKQLGDDLRRFSAGALVGAFRYSRTQLALRWLAKHETVVRAWGGALALALVCVVALVRSRSSESRRTELAESFARDVERVALDARTAYMRPLHPLEADRQRQQQALSAIEREAASLGGSYEGVREATLGRGALAMHRFDEARTYFERSLALGQRAPEVHAGLGEALGELYEAKLAEAQRLPSGTPRERGLAQVDRDLGTPALRELRQGRTAGAGATYIDALIAYHEKRTDDARALADRAVEESPGDYEAAELAGDIEANLGRDAFRRSDYEAAKRDYAEARAEYDRAVDVGRSDPSLRVRAAKLATFDLDLANATGGSREEPLERALREADAALTATPDSEQAFVQKAQALCTYARYELEHGKDPGAHLSAALSASHAAAALDPSDPFAYFEIGAALNVQAHALLESGGDLHPLLAEQIASDERAFEIEPLFVNALLEAGNAHALLAEADAAEMNDPRPELDLALENWNRSLEVMPGWAPGLISTTNGYRLKADYEFAHGIDPMETILLSIDAGNLAIAARPNDAIARLNLGIALGRKGHFEWEAEQDGLHSVEEGLLQLAQAIAVKPSYPLPYGAAALLENTVAGHAARVGADAAVHARKAIAFAEKDAALDPNNVNPLLSLATSYVLLAEDALDHGHDPTADVERAREATRRGLAVNPHHLEIRDTQSDGDLVEAIGAPSPGARRAALRLVETNEREILALAPEDVMAHAMLAEALLDEDDLTEGGVEAAKVLTLNPRSPSGVALRGVVAVLEARRAKDASARRAAASRAVEDLTHGYRPGSPLPARWRRWLDEATHLRG